MDINRNDIALLERLCNEYGPSSHEISVQRLIATEVGKTGLSVQGDNIGNLYASYSGFSGATPHIGIIAHADEIAMQVTHLDDKGMLRFRKIGGLRATSLPGHRVSVLTEAGVIDGVIGNDPMQDNGTETGIMLKTSDLWIDTFGNADKVEVGDFVVFRPCFSQVNEHTVVSKALDDRAGIWVMLNVLRMIAGSATPVCVTGISTVQEEINLRGAHAIYVPLDVAIVVDVNFTSDHSTDHPEWGNLELGKGPGICRSADTNPILRQIAEKVAKEHDIPLQVTVGRNMSGGTDAARLAERPGCASINIDIPLRYMHTHSEVIDLRDLKRTADLVYGIVSHIASNEITSFVPWQ